MAKQSQMAALGQWNQEHKPHKLQEAGGCCRKELLSAPKRQSVQWQQQGRGGQSLPVGRQALPGGVGYISGRNCLSSFWAMRSSEVLCSLSLSSVLPSYECFTADLLLFWPWLHGNYYLSCRIWSQAAFKSWIPSSQLCDCRQVTCLL